MIRTFTFLCFLCIVSLSPVFAQWASSGSGLAGNNLKVYSLSVVDDNTVWGIVRNSTFSASTPQVTRSADGGSTWDPRSFSVADSLTPVQIFALDDLTAWIILSDFNDRDGAGMIKTTTGGIAWTTIAGPFTQAGHNLKSIHFFDANVGVAFGSAGVGADNQSELHIYRSTDAGDNWAELSNLPAILAGEGTWTESGNGGYEAIGDTIWFGSSEGRVWRSVDRGSTWSVFTALSSGENLGSLAFKDHLNGLAITDMNQVYKTTDGGETWSSSAMPNTPPSLRAIEFVPGTSGTYIIHDGSAFNSRDLTYTNDGGASWFRTNGNFSMDCLAFYDRFTGYGGSTVTNAQVGGVYTWQGVVPGLTNAPTVTQAGIRLFPSPSEGEILLTWSNQAIWTVDVLSPQGQVLAHAKAMAEELQLDLSFLSPGLYWARMNSAGKSHVTSFLIK